LSRRNRLDTSRPTARLGQVRVYLLANETHTHFDCLASVIFATLRRRVNHVVCRWPASCSHAAIVSP